MEIILLKLWERKQQTLHSLSVYTVVTRKEHEKASKTVASKWNKKHNSIDTS
jgi:hypothetical protein